MKFILLYILLFSSQLFAQTKFIELTNTKSGKTALIKENSRIKLITKNGEKMFGRIKLLDSTSITLDGYKILLNDINVIKKRSIGKAFASGGLIFIGIAASAFGTILVFVAPVEGLIVYGSGVATTVFGAILPDINNGHHSKRWRYKIIEKL